MSSLDDLAPERRRALLVLTPEDSRIARLDYEVRDLLDGGQVAICELPSRWDDLDAHSLVAKLRRSNKLRPGALLVQSPFDMDEYEEADDAATAFAVKKFMLLSELCQLLGAVSVETEQVNVERRGIHQGGKIQGRIKLATFSARASRDIEKRVRESLTVADRFQGAEADVQGAREFLALHGLESDATVASLVRLREQKNSLSRRHMVVNLSQESSENLKVAASIAGVAKLANVGGDFSRNVDERIEVVLTATIEFL